MSGIRSYFPACKSPGNTIGVAYISCCESFRWSRSWVRGRSESPRSPVSWWPLTTVRLLGSIWRTPSISPAWRTPVSSCDRCEGSWSSTRSTGFRRCFHCCASLRTGPFGALGARDLGAGASGRRARRREPLHPGTPCPGAAGRATRKGAPNSAWMTKREHRFHADIVQLVGSDDVGHVGTRVLDLSDPRTACSTRRAGPRTTPARKPPLKVLSIAPGTASS